MTPKDVEFPEEIFLRRGTAIIPALIALDCVLMASSHAAKSTPVRFTTLSILLCPAWYRMRSPVNPWEHAMKTSRARVKKQSCPAVSYKFVGSPMPACARTDSTLV
eukprot:12903_5